MTTVKTIAPAVIQQDACRRHPPQIHKPSALVSFGLPDPLSFQARSHAMVARRSGTNLDRESVRVRLPSSLTRPLGNAMRTSQKSKRRPQLDAFTDQIRMLMATCSICSWPGGLDTRTRVAVPQRCRFSSSWILRDRVERRRSQRSGST